MENFSQAYLVPTLPKSTFLKNISNNLFLFFLRITGFCVGGISNKQYRHILRKKSIKWYQNIIKATRFKFRLENYQPVKPGSVQFHT